VSTNAESHLSNKGVLVIYTGGTIGSAPRDPDPDSPRVVVSWNRFVEGYPEIKALGEHFRIDNYSFPEPWDSCNAGPRQWAEMAQVIADNYSRYEGFVILHGTDTMVYTASALSFMLKNLDKPVVMTGAQRSALTNIRNDGRRNVVTALLIANPAFSKLPIIPEVCIFFGGAILRGNRSIKRDTNSFVAYESPNLARLGEAGDRIVIDRNILLRRPSQDRRLNVLNRLDPEVTTVFIYPGIQYTDQVRRQLDNPKLKAVIVLSYGLGNIPSNPDFLKVFAEARERGLILANVTQCRRGPVELGIYESSAQLLESGFIAASDITVEAAQCKLMTLLGNPDLSKEDVETLFQQDIAGEQSWSLYVTKFPGASNKSVELSNSTDEGSNLYRMPGRPFEGISWEAEHIDRAILRFWNASIISSEELVRIRIFVNLDQDEHPQIDDPSFAGEFKRYPMQKRGLAIFDVTGAVKAVSGPGRPISFTVKLETPGSAFKWEKVELALYVSESIN
jgi:L-asparaginase